MNLTAQFVTSDDLEPTSMNQAIKDTKRSKAISDKCDGLVRNGTWKLVPSDLTQNLFGGKWTFHTKYLSDGSVDRYKARLVAKGFHQCLEVDYHDTFSLVVKPTTIRLVLILAVSRGWSLRQLNNAFFQGTLSEGVYMTQDKVSLITIILIMFTNFAKLFVVLNKLLDLGMISNASFLSPYALPNSIQKTSLLISNKGGTTIYLLVYVDDIIVIGDNDRVVHKFIQLFVS